MVSDAELFVGLFCPDGLDLVWKCGVIPGDGLSRFGAGRGDLFIHHDLGLDV